MNLSAKQLERISEIFGNMSVAWFTAGAITPLFSDFLVIPVVVSLVASGFFLWMSLVSINKGGIK